MSKVGNTLVTKTWASARRSVPTPHRKPRGFAYLKLGRFDQAIADYDAALAHNPRQPGPLYGRGLARLRNDPEDWASLLSAAVLAAPYLGRGPMVNFDARMY